MVQMSYEVLCLYQSMQQVSILSYSQNQLRVLQYYYIIAISAVICHWH